MKNGRQPIRGSVPWNSRCTKDSRWLENVFLFSTEIWAEQLKNYPVYLYWKVVLDFCFEHLKCNFREWRKDHFGFLKWPLYRADLLKKDLVIKSIYNLQLENAWEYFVKWRTQRAIYNLWFVWEYFLGWERMEICKTSYLQFTAKPRSRFTSSASHCRPCSQMLVSLEITQEIWAGTMNIKD